MQPVALQDSLIDLQATSGRVTGARVTQGQNPALSNGSEIAGATDASYTLADAQEVPQGGGAGDAFSADAAHRGGGAAAAAADGGVPRRAGRARRPRQQVQLRAAVQRGLPDGAPALPAVLLVHFGLATAEQVGRAHIEDARAWAA